MRAVVLSLLLLSLSACAVNPVTGEKELSLIDSQQEIAIGEQQYVPSQQMQGGLYSIDPALQRYVAGVGQRLAAVSHRPELPYEFVVLNNAVPNAWALPGGKIAINRGLLIHLDDEAELAAVLAHEIVHAAAAHGAAQMSKSTLLGLGAQLAAIASQAGGYGQLGGQAAQLGGAAWLAKYGRDDELESDAYGMDYMAKVGYDPQGAVQLQQTFVKLSEGKQPDFISGLFASHPPSQERVRANQQHAAKLPKGERFRQRYQQRIAQLKKDQAAYDLQEKAEKALTDKKPEQALKLLDQALAIQPKAAEFWQLKAYGFYALEQMAKAEQALDKAVALNPNYFAPLLTRGVLRFELGNYQAAEQDFNASNRLLPTKTAHEYLQKLKAGPVQ